MANAAGVTPLHEAARRMVFRAFDLGVTHFDLANNYGPPYGSAETTFGLLFAQDFAPFRDELIISSKAGWDMWPGPYGDRGSRKYLVASLDQSLARMGIDSVDIFYHHRGFRTTTRLTAVGFDGMSEPNSSSTPIPRSFGPGWAIRLRGGWWWR